MIGETLLHYKITGKLGAGGMGEVFRAMDTKLEREVALKVVPEKFASDAKRLARFEREAKSVAALNHPNIVTIHSIEEDDGVHFLTMELVEGRTLDQVVPSDGLPAVDVLRMAIPMAEALAAAHDRGIVHRDLKPGNIMVTNDGRVKVLDFGLAKLLEDLAETGPEIAASQLPTATMTLTAAGIVVGTVPYLSPEYLDGQAPDQRSDIFSLGVVLYEMATGLLPFQGRSGPSVMSAILRDSPRPVIELNPDTPHHLSRLIERCLSKEPDQRYQSAEDIAYELQTLSQGSSGDVMPMVRQRRSQFQWPRKMAGVAALAVALIALGAFLLRGRQDQPVAEPTIASSEAAFNPSEWIIAVLPSKMRSTADPDLEAVNEGLALTLTAKLTQLSRSHDLQVIPASTLVERAIDGLDKARRELGVTLALNFDTHRLGEHLRINAQLIDVPNQRQLAAATIDGLADDLLALEEEVTSEVLDLLRVELRPMEQTLLTAKTTDSEAYNFFLRGQGYLQNYVDPISVETAAGYFEKALQVDPGFARARAGLGRALWSNYLLTKDLRWVDAAFEECRAAVELDGRDSEGHLCLGSLFNGTGRHREAIEEFKVAKSLDPTRDLVFKGLADAYLAIGSVELAEETYKEAVSMRPQYWAPHAWLGIFYHRHGRVDEAIDNFKEVVRLAPDSFLGYSNLGASYYFAGRLDDARQQFEKSLAIKSDDDLALANLGTLNFFEGRYEEAVGLFERAVAVNERDYFNWGNLADAYYWTPGRGEEAASAYRRAISLNQEELVVNPTNGVFLADLAYYQAMLGDKESSLASLRRAIESLPSDIDVQHRAAQVYQALGQSERALQYLEEAVGNGYPADEILADPLFSDLVGNSLFEQITQSAG